MDFLYSYYFRRKLKLLISLCVGLVLLGSVFGGCAIYMLTGNFPVALLTTCALFLIMNGLMACTIIAAFFVAQHIKNADSYTSGELF